MPTISTCGVRTSVSALTLNAPLGARTYRALLIDLVFVVVLLLALISLPPLTNGRADALRAHLDTDVQDFADALTATENSLQEMQAASRS